MNENGRIDACGCCAGPFLRGTLWEARASRPRRGWEGRDLHHDLAEREEWQAGHVVHTYSGRGGRTGGPELHWS